MNEEENFDANVFKRGSVWKLNETINVLPKKIDKIPIVEVKAKELILVRDLTIENFGGKEIFYVHATPQNVSSLLYLSNGKCVELQSFIVPAKLLFFASQKING